MKPPPPSISLTREASWASIWAYLGIAVGAANFILLLPAFLDIEKVGLVRLIAAGALIYVKIAFFGLDTSAVRFLTGLDIRSGEYAARWRLLLVLCFLGMCLASLISIPILYRNPAGLDWPGFNAAIGSTLIMLLFIATLWQRFGESIAQVAGHTAQAAMWRDFAPRVAVCCGAIGIALQLWDFGGLLYFWTGIYVVGAFRINTTTLQRGLHASPWGSLPEKRTIRETLGFASYSFLGTTAATIQTTLDSLMLASLTNLSQLGSYAPFAYAASIIQVPERALAAACYPRFRKYLKDGNLTAAQTLYRDVALLQLTVGGAVLLLLWINVPILLLLLDAPEYANGAPVLLIIGCAFWFHAALGQPTQVLLSGAHYRMQGIINSAALPLGITSNFAMIPTMGAQGAAWATAITLAVIASSKTWLVWSRYGIQPFSKTYPVVAGLIVALLLAATVFPVQEEEKTVMACLLRSLTVALICLFVGRKLDLLQQFRLLLLRFKQHD